jgi:hypothetical protein
MFDSMVAFVETRSLLLLGSVIERRFQNEPVSPLRILVVLGIFSGHDDSFQVQSALY